MWNIGMRPIKMLMINIAIEIHSYKNFPHRWWFLLTIWKHVWGEVNRPGNRCPSRKWHNIQSKWMNITVECAQYAPRLNIVNPACWYRPPKFAIPLKAWWWCGRMKSGKYWGGIKSQKCLHFWKTKKQSTRPWSAEKDIGRWGASK